jgi:hypothetical protein
MKDPSGILMIEPTGKASSKPVIDKLTRMMTAAWRRRQKGTMVCKGVHTCVCGVQSDNSCDTIDGCQTNSLSVHYLAFHREEIGEDELAKVAALQYGEAYPTKQELGYRDLAIFMPVRLTPLTPGYGFTVEHRIEEIIDVMSSYAAAGCVVPLTWLDELRELISQC